MSYIIFFLVAICGPLLFQLRQNCEFALCYIIYSLLVSFSSIIFFFSYPMVFDCHDCSSHFTLSSFTHWCTNRLHVLPPFTLWNTRGRYAPHYLYSRLIYIILLLSATRYFYHLVLFNVGKCWKLTLYYIIFTATLYSLNFNRAVKSHYLSNCVLRPFTLPTTTTWLLAHIILHYIFFVYVIVFFFFFFSYLVLLHLPSYLVIFCSLIYEWTLCFATFCFEIEDTVCSTSVPTSHLPYLVTLFFFLLF